MPEEEIPLPSSALANARQHFGEEIRALAGLHGSRQAERVIEAFRTIPREPFAGPGPWMIMSPFQTGVFQKTEDENPANLYHCVLISLDRKAGINIGEPSLWAKNLAALAIAEGAKVLQVGGGSGYYSAILAYLVGSAGKVTAFEVDAPVATIGADAVAKISNLDFRVGDAAIDLQAEDGPFDLIVAFAGVTHPVKVWLDTLSDNGAMLLPVTGSQGWGAMCVFRKVSSNRFSCETVGSCGFFHCRSARDEKLQTALDAIWSDRTRLSGWKFEMGYDDAGIQYEADGQVLSAAFS